MHNNCVITLNKRIRIMRKNILLAAILLIASQGVFAQRGSRSSEFGVFLGGSYYLGELNINGHFNSLTQPAGGVIYRYNFNPRFSLKGNLLFGNVMGDDSRSGVPSLLTRNYSFKSPINELAIEMEFNFLPFTTGDPKTPFTPYVFGGVAVFKFNPQGQI